MWLWLTAREIQNKPNQARPTYKIIIESPFLFAASFSRPYQPHIQKGVKTMINPLFSTLEKFRRVPRIALFFCLAVFLFLAGAAYADLSNAKTIPTGQDSVLPIREEESVPNLSPVIPIKSDESDARFKVIPIRHFPAVEGDQQMLAGSARLAGMPTHLLPTNAQQQFAGSQIPTLLRAK